MTPDLLPPEDLAAIAARCDTLARKPVRTPDGFTSYGAYIDAGALSRYESAHKKDPAGSMMASNMALALLVSTYRLADGVASYDIPALLSHITAQAAAYNRALDLLYEARQHIDGEIDVVDGDYGEPAPNQAMRLASAIDDILTERKSS